jgi:hypothetical protein
MALNGSGAEGPEVRAPHRRPEILRRCGGQTLQGRELRAPDRDDVVQTAWVLRSGLPLLQLVDFPLLSTQDLLTSWLAGSCALFPVSAIAPAAGQPRETDFGPSASVRGRGSLAYHAIRNRMGCGGAGERGGVERSATHLLQSALYRRTPSSRSLGPMRRRIITRHGGGQITQRPRVSSAASLRKGTTRDPLPENGLVHYERAIHDHVHIPKHF